MSVKYWSSHANDVSSRWASGLNDFVMEHQKRSDRKKTALSRQNSTVVDGFRQSLVHRFESPWESEVSAVVSEMNPIVSPNSPILASGDMPRLWSSHRHSEEAQPMATWVPSAPTPRSSLTMRGKVDVQALWYQVEMLLEGICEDLRDIGRDLSRLSKP